MGMTSNIEQAIERKRSELNLAGDKYGLTSDIVLRKSEELDELINEYTSIKFKVISAAN